MSTAPSAAEEPIEEGIRASQLRKIFVTALDRSIGTCSYENFAACFPTPASRAPAVLHTAWGQMCEFWEGCAKREYETILKERNVVAGLNQLDQLTKEAEDRRSQAKPGESPISGEESRPSTLPPSTILTAQLTPLLLAAQQEAAGKIEIVQKSNTELMETIEMQRREIEELVGVLEGKLAALQGAVGVVNDGKMGVLEDGVLVGELS